MYKIKLEPGDYIILTGLNYDQIRNLYERFGGKIEDGLIPPEFFGGSYVRKTENGAEVFFGPSPMAPISGNRLTYAKVMEKEAENDWFGKGELQPVGTVCEVYFSDSWCECKIVAHEQAAVEEVAVFKDLSRLKGSYDAYIAEAFRPIETEREKLINTAMVVGKFNGREFFGINPRIPVSQEFCERLYDAGMLKLPEQSK